MQRGGRTTNCIGRKQMRFTHQKRRYEPSQRTGKNITEFLSLKLQPKREWVSMTHFTPLSEKFARTEIIAPRNRQLIPIAVKLENVVYFSKC